MTTAPSETSALNVGVWGLRKVLSRRLFIGGAAVVIAGLRGRIARAFAWKETVQWLWEVVKNGIPSLDDIFRGLVTLKVNYKMLTDDKTRSDKIRRDLTDASSEKGLQTKLGSWLKRFDAFANEKQRPGESIQDFTARKERERQQLERDWKQLRNDAIDALKTIKTMGEDLERVLPDSMPSAEWRRYKELLNDEKEVTGFLDADMPSDPAVIDRLREVDEQLRRIIQTIDKYAGELDAAIKKAG